VNPAEDPDSPVIRTLRPVSSRAAKAAEARERYLYRVLTDACVRCGAPARRRADGQIARTCEDCGEDDREYTRMRREAM
jgi:hypothetical protein